MDARIALLTALIFLPSCDSKPGVADDDGKALRIASVASEPGPTVMNQKTRRIVARVENVGAGPVDLWIHSRDGEKIAKEQHLMEVEDRKLTGDAAVQEIPYGLGIEAGSPEKGTWHPAVSNWIWLPVGADPKVGEPILQVALAAGETRAFGILMPAEGEIFAAKTFRVFLVNPRFQRIDEKVLGK
jgi:hypothetical protein